MKQTIILGLFLVVLGAACQSNSQKQEQPEKGQNKWELVWSEEFNETGMPDTTVWTYEEGFIRNNELQYYTVQRPENARQEDGKLVITSRKENYKDGNYTSASLKTEGKKLFKYGRIEVRAQLPTGRGMWPAIWMLGENIGEVGWPDCGEIDIMENVGFDPDTIHANIHTEAYNHVKGTNKGNAIKVEAPYDQYHVYAVNWYKDSMKFFVDDRAYFTFKNEQKGSATWPFDQPHYLILNAAIGGGWGGQQGVDDSIFPQQYSIDYVRYYKQK